MILSALFSGVEAAFLSLNRIEKNRIYESSDFFDLQTAFFLSHFDRFLISLLFFNLINNTIAASSGTLLFARILNTILENPPKIKILKSAALYLTNHEGIKSVIFVTGFTFLVLVFSELTPKRLAIKYKNNFIKIAALPMKIIFFITTPLSVFFCNLSENFINKFHSQKDEENTTTETGGKEFLGYIKEGSRSGALKRVESHMLQNLINYKNIPVKSMIIPRQKMHGLDINDLPDTLPEFIRNFPYNTIPIYEDLKDHFIGILSKKKLYINKTIDTINQNNIKKHLIKPKIHHEGKEIIDVFSDMYESGDEIAVIADEYGGIEGFVTYRDLADLLLGRKESREEGLLQITKISPYVFKVNPDTKIHLFNRFFKVNLKSNHAETLSGYILEKIHRFPAAGEMIHDKMFDFEIKKVSKRKILSLKVYLIHKEKRLWLS